MPNRSKDWFQQSPRDLAQAEDSFRAGRHEWACFVFQQAAEKAVKSLRLFLGEEAWGHVVARLLAESPEKVQVPSQMIEKAKC